MSRFDQPCGTQADRDQNPWTTWTGGWYSSNPYGTYYALGSGYSYHTGDDLNLPNYADSNAPIYASADGEVVFAGSASGFEDLTVCIKHAGMGENGADCWTRYSHMQQLVVTKGQMVKRGTKLAILADYSNNGPPNDHSHFDVARLDLGKYPADWPGLDLAELQRNYINPKTWIQQHRTEGEEMAGAYARTTYGRRVAIAWRGDGRWPQHPSSTREQRRKLEDKRDVEMFTLGDSHDDAGLAIITTAGAKGTETVELWGWPNDPAVRDTFVNGFYKPNYPHATIQFHAWSELDPAPPGGRVEVTAEDGVKSRIGASTSAAVIGTLLYGAVITPIRTDTVDGVAYYAYNWGAGGVPAYKVGSTSIGAEAFSQAQYFKAVP